MDPIGLLARGECAFGAEPTIHLFGGDGGIRTRDPYIANVVL